MTWPEINPTGNCFQPVTCPCRKFDSTENLIRSEIWPTGNHNQRDSLSTRNFTWPEIENLNFYSTGNVPQSKTWLNWKSTRPEMCSNPKFGCSRMENNQFQYQYIIDFPKKSQKFDRYKRLIYRLVNVKNRFYKKKYVGVGVLQSY